MWTAIDFKEDRDAEKVVDYSDAVVAGNLDRYWRFSPSASSPAGEEAALAEESTGLSDCIILANTPTSTPLL